MKQMFKGRSLHTLLAIVSSGLYVADGSVQEPLREVQVRLHGWPFSGFINKDTRIHRMPTLYYKVSGGFEALKIHRQQTTGPYTFVLEKGTQEVELFEKQETLDPNTGESTVSMVARVKSSFPEEWAELLLLVFPDSRDGALYKSMPMNTTPDSLPDGCVRMVNGSQNRLAVMAGGGVHMLEPTRSIQFKPKMDLSENRFRVVIKRENDGRWDTIYSSSATYVENSATLMIIYPVTSRRVQVMNIGEVR